MSGIDLVETNHRMLSFKIMSKVYFANEYLDQSNDVTFLFTGIKFYTNIILIEV